MIPCKPRDGGDVQVLERQLASRHDLVYRAQRRFHDAARVGKDVRRSRGGSEDAVHGAVGQAGKIDSRLPDHPAQLPGGEDHVHVPHSAGVHLGSLGLVLLGRAGHDGDDEDVLGLLPDLLREVRLGHGAEHLLGGLARGDVGQDVRPEMLCIPDPARASSW